MKYILTSLLLFVSVISFSQATFTDSLWAEYNKSNVDTAKIDIILFSSDYLRDTKPEAAISFGKVALKTAQKIQDNRREMLLLDLIGQGYNQVGDIANAISYFNDCYKIANRLLDLRAIAAINLNLGACYTDVGNGKLGADYYKRAVDEFAKLNDKMGLCKSQVYLSDALYKAKNPDKSLYYLEKVKPLSIELNGYLLHYVYTNFAECYFLKNEFRLALDNVDKAMYIAGKLNDLYVISADNLILAKVYLATNDYTKAEMYVKKGLGFAQQTKIRENLIDAYNLYSKIFEKQGKFAEALKFKTLFITTKDSLESALNDYILRAYENEKRDGEFATIKTNELQKNAELKRQKYVIIFFGVALITIIGITVYVFYSRISLKRANIETKIANEELKINQSEIIYQNEILLKNNEQISRQSEDIKKLNSLKDRLFSIIAHDLRSPLKNLRGVLNLLQEGDLSPDKFLIIVPKLEKGLVVTSDLVENLLNWSRSQLNGMSVSKTNFDIYHLAEKQLQLFERQVADKKLEIENKTLENSVALADKDMVELVLRNLVANAIKFSHRGGRITISAKESNNQIEVSISDEGVGISPDNVHKIFQEDERYTTRGTANEAGTGLGLLLCKDFIEKNNGTIGVESVVQVGSRFWFTLPTKNDT